MWLEESGAGITHSFSSCWFFFFFSVFVTTMVDPLLDADRCGDDVTTLRVFISLSLSVIIIIITTTETDTGIQRVTIPTTSSVAKETDTGIQLVTIPTTSSVAKETDTGIQLVTIQTTSSVAKETDTGTQRVTIPTTSSSVVTEETDTGTHRPTTSSLPSSPPSVAMETREKEVGEGAEWGGSRLATAPGVCVAASCTVLIVAAVCCVGVWGGATGQWGRGPGGGDLVAGLEARAAQLEHRVRLLEQQQQQQQLQLRRRRGGPVEVEAWGARGEEERRARSIVEAVEAAPVLTSV
ncbi:unnamed protein product [Lampetra fluviatilis]